MYKVIDSEVLVIGSGGAGLRTAIELFDNGVDVLVVGKCAKRDAHTILATGGINAALGNMDPKDNWKLHAADTIKDGSYINNPQAVIIATKNAKQAIAELDKWGVCFAKQKGKILQRFFGPSTYRRACFVGDVTGLAILNALVDQVKKRKVRFKSEVYITHLLTKNGKVNGALGLDIRKGELLVFHTALIVLCTGGHSRMFKRSSSRFWENNGDGIKLAYDLGAAFMDMEMFQFHPTGMVYPKNLEGTLVTEAIRGEGGRLYNSKGERFMEKYDPQRFELSARDIVARAIYHELKAGNGTKHGGVWLDITFIPPDHIKKRLPKMVKQFKSVGIDITKEKMEVSPTAHYSMGGVYIDYKTGKTTVSGLYAVGEITSGMHGANRLGGNSLLELIVFGRMTGQQVLKDLKKTKKLELDLKKIEEKADMVHCTMCKSGKNPLEVKQQLMEEMWQYVGVERNEKGLQTALKKLQKYKNIKLKITGSLKMNKNLIAALDIRNMIPTCEMIIKAALKRKESRGAHYRSDYPKTKSSWKKNILCKPEKRGLKLWTKKVPSIPGEIFQLMIKMRKYQYLE